MTATMTLPDQPDATREGLSFEEVFASQLPFVARVVSNFGIPDRDVEDACQEVFMVVHRRLPELDDPGALKTWVYRIAWRVAANRRRRSDLPTRRPRELNRDRAVDAASAHAAQATEARDTLRYLLSQIDEDKRAVFVLYELEQLSMREVCELVGCPLQTGYSRLKAARAAVLRGWKSIEAEGGA